MRDKPRKYFELDGVDGSLDAADVALNQELLLLLAKVGSQGQSQLGSLLVGRVRLAQQQQRAWVLH